jgi:hypothetical protein
MSKIERIVIIALALFILGAVGWSVWRAVQPEQEAVVLPETTVYAYLTCYIVPDLEVPWEWSVPYDNYRDRPMQDIRVTSPVILSNGMIQALDYEDGGIYLCDRFILRGIGVWETPPEAVMPEGESA